MLPVSEADFLGRKTGFWSYSGHKTTAVVVLDFGKGGFGCGDGGVRLRRYGADNADDGDIGERRRRTGWGIWRRWKR